MMCLSDFITPEQEAEEEAIQLWIDGRIPDRELFQRLRALGRDDYEIHAMMHLYNG